MIRGTAKRAGAVLLVVMVALALVGCSGGHKEAAKTVVPPAAASIPRTILRVGALQRSVFVHDPARTVGSLLPALILLHGASGSSTRMEGATGMSQIASADGFVLAYGQGTTTGRPVGGGSWNAGRCCAAAAATGVDDIAYLDAVIDELIADHHVDPARVYLGGFSNGGMMTYRAACEIGNRLAGVVVVSGALNTGSCAAPVALSVLVIHGKADSTVPYDGGRPNKKTAGRLGTWVNSPVSKGIHLWAARDECTGKSAIDTSKALTDVAYTGCVSGTRVELVTIARGTHRWPTQTNEGFDASNYIVNWLGLTKVS